VFLNFGNKGFLFSKIILDKQSGCKKKFFVILSVLAPLPLAPSPHKKGVKGRDAGKPIPTTAKRRLPLLIKNTIH